MFPVITAETEEILEKGQSEHRLAWKLTVAAVPCTSFSSRGTATNRHCWAC